MDMGGEQQPNAGGDESRHTGKVARWTADRGFGFIEPEDGAPIATSRADDAWALGEARD